MLTQHKVVESGQKIPLSPRKSSLGVKPSTSKEASTKEVGQTKEQTSQVHTLQSDHIALPQSSSVDSSSIRNLQSSFQNLQLDSRNQVCVAQPTLSTSMSYQIQPPQQTRGANFNIGMSQGQQSVNQQSQGQLSANQFSQQTKEANIFVPFQNPIPSQQYQQPSYIDREASYAQYSQALQPPQYSQQLSYMNKEASIPISMQGFAPPYQQQQLSYINREASTPTYSQNLQPPQSTKQLSYSNIEANLSKSQQFVPQSYSYLLEQNSQSKPPQAFYGYSYPQPQQNIGLVYPPTTQDPGHSFQNLYGSTANRDNLKFQPSLSLPLQQQQPSVYTNMPIQTQLQQCQEQIVQLQSLIASMKSNSTSAEQVVYMQQSQNTCSIFSDKANLSQWKKEIENLFFLNNIPPSKQIAVAYTFLSKHIKATLNLAKIDSFESLCSELQSLGKTKQDIINSLFSSSKTKSQTFQQYAQYLEEQVSSWDIDQDMLIAIFLSKISNPRVRQHLDIMKIQDPNVTFQNMARITDILIAKSGKGENVTTTPPKNNGSDQKSIRAPSTIVCYKCKQVGHKSSQCTQDLNKVNMIQELDQIDLSKLNLDDQVNMTKKRKNEAGDPVMNTYKPAYARNFRDYDFIDSMEKYTISVPLLSYCAVDKQANQNLQALLQSLLNGTSASNMQTSNKIEENLPNIEVKVSVDGETRKAQVDTGAGCVYVSNNYIQKNNLQSKIDQNHNIFIKTAEGHISQTHGTLWVKKLALGPFEFDDVPMYVTNSGDYDILLGRAIIIPTNFHHINGISYVQDQNGNQRTNITF